MDNVSKRMHVGLILKLENKGRFVGRALSLNKCGNVNYKI